MSVFVANFGEQNYEWSVCRERGTIATMNEVSSQKLWEANDRDGYIANRLNTRTAAGNLPTRAVAARWYNLMTTIVESVDDIWLHSDGTFVWWTVSQEVDPTFESKIEPVGRKREVVVCHKPCSGWRHENKLGNPLPWNGLHPKAKDFLATEATFQRLNPDYAAYALALINGEDLGEWHERREWKLKVEESKKKSGPGLVFNDLQRAAWRMADTAFRTTRQSNGQQIERTVKNKDFLFHDKEELRRYICDLIKAQEYHCALSGLELNLDELSGDPEMRASLDRIDSDGHYERDNLQVVCRFINRWKGADKNSEFQRLIERLQHAIFIGTN